jgi:ATP-dependent DNA helicase RecG
VTAQRLADAGIACVRDLLFLFPRSYEDYRRVYRLGELTGVPAGTTVVVRGDILRVHKFFRRMLDVVIEEDGSRLRARWFRPNAGMLKGYLRGTRVAFAGRLRWAEDGMPELIHPSNVTAILSERASVGIRPRYPLIEGVPGRTLEKVAQSALRLAAGGLVDALPKEVRQRHDLPDLERALHMIHLPPDDLPTSELLALRTGSAQAVRRFAIEELLVLQTILLVERRELQGTHGLPCTRETGATLASLRAALPFALTHGQVRAIEHIVALFAAGPAQCLVQGDVGSGKTAVAFAACLHVVRAGGQCLFMAPTAVLAEQHLRTLRSWSERLGVRVGLLHAGLPGADQRHLLDGAAAGTVDVVVGTHALLEGRLRLPRLALAVVDEQHRFGVEQRARLRRIDRSENGWKIDAQNGMVPHLLVLSATPIPRSMALACYGELDLVSIEGLPPGRSPVRTQLCRGQVEGDAAYARVRALLGQGGQAFVVCPAVVGSDDGGEHADRPASVLSRSRALRKQLAPARVGLVHGQMEGGKQQEVLRAFRDGRLDVLVATTILEVGVDVPSATCMVIENAERFGLAQLHQLRGRVGRSSQQSYCFLLTQTDDSEALDRLRFLADEPDGFRIAEEDLRRRGAGDLRGTRQTGAPEVRFADLAGHGELVALARGEAERILAADPELAMPDHQGLREAVARRLQRARPIAEEAG